MSFRRSRSIGDNLVRSGIERNKGGAAKSMKKCEKESFPPENGRNGKRRIWNGLAGNEGRVGLVRKEKTRKEAKGKEKGEKRRAGNRKEVNVRKEKRSYGNESKGDWKGSGGEGV